MVTGLRNVAIACVGVSHVFPPARTVVGGHRLHREGTVPLMHCRNGDICRRTVAAASRLYRLRLIIADPLSLRDRTVCDLPCKTTLNAGNTILAVVEAVETPKVQVENT
jgi:hypothetical protein